ncbi:XRE family transcriptional regulator [Lactonifactor longoviformis]|uniref:DNA-binding transcriptional regulator, XRE-family HTH domain n=1 Tax=Lactonifactor longoviformis DSM 17459 TaxID=1122155 RepID=A0A1M5CYF3_9CLOT|nr:helix-turn-helix transcriptional regulator [Lactonifactor longoviformis]POP30146.1 XRE family transcriptional regulator [Lactonifactor longoviformis]SHF59667.1 DNA-binding transcriptional regulator, XRE-family HTH domain [Lactonifactor longoviformis DSM 17459]
MNKLRDLREDMDKSQSFMAKLLNVNQTTYHRYETEELNIPVESLKTLAKYFGTSVDYLLCLTDERKPYPRKPVD